jgi:hypothetical protein
MNRQEVEISNLILQEKLILLKYQKSLLQDVISFFKGVVIVFLQHPPLLTLNSSPIVFFKIGCIEIPHQPSFLILGAT